MKKVCILLLAGVLLLSFAGCQQATPNLYDPSHLPPDVTPGQTRTNYEGLQLEIQTPDWQAGNTPANLVVNWHNQTPYDVFYGAAFSIERLDGEAWVSCAIPEDPIFDLLAYQLKAGQTASHSYLLTGQFDVSIPGTYRFQTTCHVYDSGESSTLCTLTAEFAVGSNQPPEIPSNPTAQP